MINTKCATGAGRARARLAEKLASHTPVPAFPPSRQVRRLVARKAAKAAARTAAKQVIRNRRKKAIQA